MLEYTEVEGCLKEGLHEEGMHGEVGFSVIQLSGLTCCLDYVLLYDTHTVSKGVQ